MYETDRPTDRPSLFDATRAPNQTDANAISFSITTIRHRFLLGILYYRSLRDPRIVESANPMTERRFPPLAMTGDTTDMSSASYGKGTYVANASGEFYGNGTDCAHHAFDRVVHGGGEEEGSDVTHWHSNGLDDSEGWIRLDMPVRIRVTRYALHSRNNDLVTGTDFPDTFVLEGSKAIDAVDLLHVLVGEGGGGLMAAVLVIARM